MARAFRFSIFLQCDTALRLPGNLFKFNLLADTIVSCGTPFSTHNTHLDSTHSYLRQPLVFRFSRQGLEEPASELFRVITRTKRETGAINAQVRITAERQAVMPSGLMFPEKKG